MKSLRIKLFTGISMFVVALALLIVGVWAVGETQTITMQGSVNFEIADKSLYVQDVRIQEDNNSSPYSLKEQGKFMPGYINGNFDMDLGNFTNNYGSFALYFDIINTMDETTSETYAYTVEQPTAPSGTTVSVSILGLDGTTLQQIPEGTVKPSEISDNTQATATIKLTITSTSGAQVDLSEITITINQFISQIYDYFTFEVNEGGKTVTLTEFNSSLSDSTDIVIPSTVDLVDGVWQDGFTYKVTAIASGISSDGVFYNSGITSIEFPSTLQSIGDYAFYYCSGLQELFFPKGISSIGDSAFQNCSGLTVVDLSNCTNLTSIGVNTFYGCRRLTSVDFDACTNLVSIGDLIFYGCYELTDVNFGGCTNLTSIGRLAFYGCDSLISVIFPNTTGWYVTTSQTELSGTSVVVTTPSVNAENLIGQYINYYWKRNG